MAASAAETYDADKGRMDTHRQWRSVVPDLITLSPPIGNWTRLAISPALATRATRIGELTN